MIFEQIKYSNQTEWRPAGTAGPMTEVGRAGTEGPPATLTVWRWSINLQRGSFVLLLLGSLQPIFT